MTAFRRRLEDALVDASVLGALCDEPGLRVEEVVERVLDVDAFGDRVDDALVEDRVHRLVAEGHLTEVDGRVRLTEGGLEDLRAAEAQVRAVARRGAPDLPAPRGTYAAPEAGP